VSTTGVPLPSPTDYSDPPPPNRRTAVVVMAVFTVLAVVAAVFGGGLLSRTATTSDGDFAGETVEVVIPLAEGGGTDTWARFVGQGLTRALPGRPGFAPVNDAGGEGIAGTNRFFVSAEADGTHLLVSTATSVVPWLLGRSEVQYDFDDLTPVLANGTGAVVYARTGAGVSGPQDLVNRAVPLKFGGISATGLDLTTLVAFDLLDTDVDAIFGFEGRGPVGLALQRGEVDIDYQTTSAYAPSVQPLVDSGAAVPLFSLGQVDTAGDIVRDPNFPDIPTVVEVYRTLHGSDPSGPAYEAYRTLLGVTYTYQKAMWVPQDTPPQATELLRRSAEEMGVDPVFNAEAEKVLGGYPIVADPRLPERIAESYRVDDDVKSYVVDLLATRYDVKID
jgi:tripartite-type tricarboxylate transporter receptor subunit TctC